MSVYFVDIGECKIVYNHCLNFIFIIIVNLITIILFFLLHRLKDHALSQQWMTA
jgi:hypothetical protein